MIKNRDIIVIGIQAWDIEIGSNCKNIAEEFSKNNRVLYVNPPLDRKTAFKNRNEAKIQKRIEIIKGKNKAVEAIHNNLWTLYPNQLTESINKLWVGKLYEKLNRRNAHLFFSAIQTAIEELNFTNYIVFNDSSMFLGQHVRDFLEPELYIYYIRDYLINNPYWKKHGVKMEPKLIANADLIVCNSEFYAQYASEFNENSHMIGQGCKTDSFNDDIQEIQSHPEMNEISKPIVGYLGMLSSRRLDIKLLIELAQKAPEINFVFIGPQDEAFAKSDLHKMANVYFLGNKSPESLPQYLKAFDVCINPQAINLATNGNYPRKIDEYLAMGKPVIATATVAMNYFSEHCYLAKTTEEYLEFIQKALRENDEELVRKRKVFARSHSWENNVKLIYEHIDRSLKNKAIHHEPERETEIE